MKTPKLATILELTEQELQRGWIITKCTSCGDSTKHQPVGEVTYPGFGVYKCVTCGSRHTWRNMHLKNQYARRKCP